MRLSRRDFLRNAAVGTAAVALSESIFCSKSPKPPNIIFIMADDLGYGDLSCYGQQKFSTPNLDAMASQGLRFTQHYAGSTVCAPSRCCLMTGQHTGHAYIRDNQEIQPEGQWPLPENTITIARLLQQEGYRTGVFGKWGLGFPGSEGEPLRQGFDEFFGYNCQRLAHNYFPEYLWHNHQKVALDGQVYAHDLIFQQALEFIRVHQKRPFFCYLPVTIPHAAMQIPEHLARPFRQQFPQFEKVIGHYDGTTVQNPIAAFAAMVTHLDRQVGQLLALLQELGIDRKTLVFFTSDNGPHLEGGHDPDFFASHGPLRGYKRDLYDGGIRVPLIAYWPGTIAAGRQSAQVCAFWDLMATLCDLIQIPIPAQSDGLSILPTLLGQKDRQQSHEFLYWEFRSQGGKQALRQGDWKAVKLGLRENPNAPIALFNLQTDLSETRDVATAYPEVVRRMQSIFRTARTESQLFRLFEPEN